MVLTQDQARKSKLHGLLQTQEDGQLLDTEFSSDSQIQLPSQSTQLATAWLIQTSSTRLSAKFWFLHLSHGLTHYHGDLVCMLKWLQSMAMATHSNQTSETVLRFWLTQMCRLDLQRLSQQELLQQSHSLGLLQSLSEELQWLITLSSSITLFSLTHCVIQTSQQLPTPLKDSQQDLHTDSKYSLETLMDSATIVKWLQSCAREDRLNQQHQLLRTQLTKLS